MPYRAAKISFDGSHYIATPKENFPQGHKRRRASLPPTPKEVAQKEQFEVAYGRVLRTNFAVRQKSIGDISTYTLALYHIHSILSIKYKQMFVFYCFNFKNPCSKALLAKVFSPTEKATRIYLPALSISCISVHCLKIIFRGSYQC